MELRDFVGLGGVPVVIALVEAVKQAVPALDKRWLPLVALALGEAWTVGTALVFGEPVREAVLLGVIVGLSAVGLFSGVRATAGR